MALCIIGIYLCSVEIILYLHFQRTKIKLCTYVVHFNTLRL